MSGGLARFFRGDPTRPPPGAPTIAVAVGAVVLLWLVPYAVGPYYVGVSTEILLFGLWALSLNVLAGTAGLVSLGHAGFLGLTSYGVAVAMGRWDWSFWAAAALAVLVTQAVCFVYSLTITRASGVYFLMITLAQGMLIWGVAQRWVSVTDGDNGLRGATRPELFGPYYLYYWFVLVIVLLCVVILRWFLTSTAGLRLRGVKDSPTRMASLGYSVTLQKLIAFNVAGFFAAVAGVLHAGYYQFVSPSTVFLRESVQGLLMVILGGVGTFLGPLVGAAGVIGARTVLSVYTDRWTLLMGVLLIVVVLFAPQGLTGWLAERLRRRPTAGTAGPSETAAGPGDAAEGVTTPPPTTASVSGGRPVVGS